MTLALAYSTLRLSVAKDLGQANVYDIAATATGPDPGRWAICAASSPSLLRSDGADPSALIGHWVYGLTNTNLGQVRKAAWWVPHMGALWLDAPLPATLAPSDDVLVTWPFPAIGRSNVIGLYELIRDALAHLLIEVPILLLTVRDRREYVLDGFPTLIDRPLRKADFTVYDPARAEGAPRRPTDKAWDLKFDNGVPTISFPNDRGWHQDGAIWEVRGQFPASGYLNGAASTTGIVADTGTVPVEAEDLKRAVRPLAYRQIGLGNVPGFSAEQQATYRGMYVEALQDARRLPTWDRTADALPDALPTPERRAA